MAKWDDYLTKPHSEQVKLEFPIKSLDFHQDKLITAQQDFISFWIGLENIHSI